MGLLFKRSLTGLVVFSLLIGSSGCGKKETKEVALEAAETVETDLTDEVESEVVPDEANAAESPEEADNIYDRFELLESTIVGSESESIVYNVVIIVPEETTEDQIMLYAKALSENLKESDKMCAAFFAFYDDKVFVNREKRVAGITWAPNGDYSDADLVKTRDYSSHELKLRSYNKLRDNAPTLSDDEKLIYDAMKKQFESNLANKVDVSEQEVFQKIAEQFGITADEVKDISYNASSRR